MLHTQEYRGIIPKDRCLEEQYYCDYCKDEISFFILKKIIFMISLPRKLIWDYGKPYDKSAYNLYFSFYNFIGC